MNFIIMAIVRFLLTLLLSTLYIVYVIVIMGSIGYVMKQYRTSETRKFWTREFWKSRDKAPDEGFVV